MYSTFPFGWRRRLPQLLELGGTLFLATMMPVRAQEAPAPAPAAPAVATATTALEGDAALQTPISLTARRRPLGELLREVQQKTGVEVLAEAPGLDAKLVTLRVKNTLLSTLLEALAKLYGLEVRKDDQGRYKLQPSPRTALERLLPQLVSARSNQDYANQKDPVDWISEVFGSVDEAALQSTEGVALPNLPAELQAKLREKIEARNLFFVADQLRAQTPESLTQGVLKAFAYQVNTTETDAQGVARRVTKAFPEVLRVMIVDEQGTDLVNFRLGEPKTPPLP